MDTVNAAVGGSNLSLTSTGSSVDDLGIGVGDSLLTFLDENSSVVFKGVINPNGTFVIDPSQFVNILLDQSQLAGQAFLDTSNMALQMLQIPGGVSAAGGKAMLSGSQSYNSDKVCHMKSFQDFGSRTTPEMQLYTQIGNPPQDSMVLPMMQLEMPQHIPLAFPRQTSPKTNNRCVSDSAATLAAMYPPDAGDTSRPKTFICSICAEVFPGHQQLRKHKATHVDEKPFRCEQCSMAFNFEVNLKLHLVLHEAEQSGNLQCKTCLAKFSRLASLKSHLRTHEKEENLVCNECGEEVSTLAKLNDHMEEHNTRVQQCMVYRCKLCGKTFNSQALLKDHSKGHAEVRKELKSFARQRPRSKAKPKDSSSAVSLSRSSKSKQKMKRVCSVCSKAFDKPSQLERHFRVHSGAKPFKCSYPDCNKCFNQKVTLDSHILACHERLKPFKCHMCSISFSQRGNLKSHIVKVHIPSGESGKIFKCEECACVYRRLATLNHHIARIHAIVSTGEVATQPSAGSVDPVNTSSTALPQDAIAGSTATNSTISDQLHLEGHHLLSQPQPAATDATDSTSQAPNTSNQVSVEEIIHEVNCVYGDSLGAPKRCRVKVKKVGQMKYHLCPACPKSFRKPSDLIRHIRCNICSKSFAVKSTLNTHLKTHELVKTLSCNTCQKKFSVLSSLKSHERLHTGAKPFQCMQCGKQFRTSSQRRVHQKTHARSALGLTGRRKLMRIGEPKPSIALSDPLKITSAGLIPVPNRFLGSTTGSTDDSPRPHRCTQPDCISSFKKSSHLKQHLLSHSGERPYKCLQCHRNFISSGVLKNHIKTHEGVRAFSCDECHVAFTTNGSLKRHMATHIHERLFICPYCAKTFKTSVSTRKHINKVHRNEADSSCTLPALTTQENVSRMVINPLQHPIDAEYAHEHLPDTQICDTADLTEIYGSDFSEMNQVLSSQLTLDAQGQSHLQINSATELSCDPETIICDPIDHCHEAVIHNHSASDNILEYTLLEEVDSGEHLDLPLDQEPNFDPSIFTLQLQQGESLDLQFLQDSQGMGNDTGLSQIVSYEFESETIEPEEVVESALCAPGNQASQEEVVPQEGFILSPSIDLPVIQRSTLKNSFQRKKLAKKAQHPAASTEESVEVRNLKEVTRPISEQLYTELATVPYQRRLKFDVGNRNQEGNKDCPFCDTKFKKKSDLDRHCLIHTGEKPYRCGVCGKFFRVKSTRQAHMRTHDEKKKTVACHVCSNLFSTKSSLRVHLRSHLNLKPYPCPFPNCTRQFRTSGHRKSHIQSHFKEAKKRKLDDHNQQTIKKEIILPSVESIKDTNNATEISHQFEQLGQPVQSFLETPTSAIGVPEGSQVVDGVQLQFDGMHFTTLDMNSLQVDDTFLQNVTNVIFVPAGTRHDGGTEVVDGTNMIIGLLPGQELTPGSDLTYGIQLTTDQLATTGAVTVSDNVQQYIIHNEMMSSTARPSSTRPTNAGPAITSSSTHSQGPYNTAKRKVENPKKLSLPKRFKCPLCPKTFVQQGSMDLHVKGHSKQKLEFLCPRCPYRTQRKPNLKMHFSRAHPNNWEEFNQVVSCRPACSN